MKEPQACITPQFTCIEATVEGSFVPGSAAPPHFHVGLGTCLAVLLGVGTLAHAAPARVAIFLLPEPDVPPKVVARLSGALQRALAADPRLEVKDSDKLLLEFSGEIPNDRINRANADYDEGLAKLRAGRAAEAIPLLERSVSAYEEVLAFVKKDLLARAWLALGVAQASSPRHARRAFATFVELLTWRPMLAYDTTLDDARHLTIFERARTAVKNLKRGSVELLTDPAGARAYVDGRYVGVTPTTTFGLRVGQHYATYMLAGFIKAAQKITVNGNEQRRYSLQLRQSEKFLLLQQSLDGAKRKLGSPTASGDMTSLQSFLYLDQVIFATVHQASPGRVTVKAFLYDLRSKLRLNQVSDTVEIRMLPADGISPLARNLYLNVRTDGVREAPPDAPPPPPPKRKRFYTTWWFWSAIAVGAATIAVTTAVWPSAHNCAGDCRWARF